MDEAERGVWIVKTAQVIPDNERWLHTFAARADLDEALAQSAHTERAESDLGVLTRKIKMLRQSSRPSRVIRPAAPAPADVS